MKKIIQHIKETLFADEELTYIENYPIKIVHDQARVNEEDVLEKLHEIEFFDQNGFSHPTHTYKTINFLHENTPKHVQSVSFAISSKPCYTTFSFSEKYPGDRWKKITDDEALRAVIEISNFSSSDECSMIETELRDIMRSRKEVPLLKKVGFIWIADLSKDQDISKIMKHYFGKNHTLIDLDEKRVFIGWNEQLQNINMRYFAYSITP